MKFTKVPLLIFLLFISVNLSAQVFSEFDVEVCNSKFSLALEKSLSQKPINEIIIEVAKSFLGTDYKASTLESSSDENLVINLSAFDCTTFIENVIAISRCIQKDKTTFEDYLAELQFIRYRNGEINQYPSRLHYFSDWIYNNAEKNIVIDMTKEIGGEPISFDVNYMSTHPNSYSQLKDNEEFISLIKIQEEQIGKRFYYFIPRNSVMEADEKINDGDIIAFTTNIEGLDIGHVGLAIRMGDGKIHLLHAPVVGSKVQISEFPISEYIKKVKKHTGIIVVRSIDVNSAGVK
ncbi:MAG TPA: DUF1460 domain-containing protein [Ignavibacteriaceae bacterium]|nr:DUF1460 domain-containing protein [Ignavibacteriaceae bacterium]